MTELTMEDFWHPSAWVSYPPSNELNKWVASNVCQGIIDCVEDGTLMVHLDDKTGKFFAWFSSWDLPDELVERGDEGLVTKSSVSKEFDLFNLLTEQMCFDDEDQVEYARLLERAAEFIRRRAGD